MPETTLDALVAYFWEHGERYAPAVLCNHLVGQGYDPVLVDQASAAYQAERAQLVGPEPGAELSPAAGGRGGRTLRPFLVGLGVALGNGGLLFLSFREAAATFSGADVHPQLTESRPPDIEGGRIVRFPFSGAPRWHSGGEVGFPGSGLLHG